MPLKYVQNKIEGKTKIDEGNYVFCATKADFALA